MTLDRSRSLDLLTALYASEASAVLERLEAVLEKHRREAMAADIDELLATTPCDTAIVRGPLPQEIRRVLVPVRGGPLAELAVRIGMRLRPSQSTVLHLTAPGAEQPDAPFAGLDRVLRRLPEVDLQRRVTSDPAQTQWDGK